MNEMWRIGDRGTSCAGGVWRVLAYNGRATRSAPSTTLLGGVAWGWICPTALWYEAL